MIATVLTAINYSFSLLSRPTERRNACIGTTTLIFLVLCGRMFTLILLEHLRAGDNFMSCLILHDLFGRMFAIFLLEHLRAGDNFTSC